MHFALAQFLVKQPSGMGLLSVSVVQMGSNTGSKLCMFFLIAVKMFNVRKNGFPCKAWLAGCTEARRALPSSSLVSCRVTQEPAGFLTLCLKMGVSQLARAQRDSGKEVARGAGGRG